MKPILAISPWLELARRELRRRKLNRLPKEFRGLRRSAPQPGSVSLWGFLTSEIGLGAAARGFAATLRATCADFRCHSIGLDGRDHVPFRHDAANVLSAVNIIVVNPPELLMGNQYVPSSLLRHSYRIGHWTWELREIPSAWLPALNLVDEIWTCSEFVAEAIRPTTSKPVSVIPYVVEDWVHLAREDARQRIDFIPGSTFVFYSVFDFASGFERKNPLATVRAFQDAFPNVTDPQRPHLILKCHSAAQYALAREELRDAGGTDPNIHVLDKVLSPSEMGLLKDACDCFVSLHRAEGFGLNIAEAMLAKNTIICTAYSGNMDFSTDANSFLINYKLVAPRDPPYCALGNQVWAEPNVSEAAAAMRFVVRHPACAAMKSSLGRQTILERYSREAATKALWARLGEIPSAIRPRRLPRADSPKMVSTELPPDF